jgi:hypothetical protein
MMKKMILIFAVLLTALMAPVSNTWAADSSSSVGTVIKHDAKATGHAVAHGAKAVGSAVVTGGKKVGHFVKTSAHKIGTGFKKAVHSKKKQGTATKGSERTA